jgi:predicted nuclease of predicted toxin-antitoxin system
MDRVAELLALSGARVPSVVFIRQNVDRKKAVMLVRRVLDTCADALAAGSLVSVTADQIRVRALPV